MHNDAGFFYSTVKKCNILSPKATTSHFVVLQIQWEKPFQIPLISIRKISRTQHQQELLWDTSDPGIFTPDSEIFTPDPDIFTMNPDVFTPNLEILTPDPDSFISIPDIFLKTHDIFTPDPYSFA